MEENTEEDPILQQTGVLRKFFCDFSHSTQARVVALGGVALVWRISEEIETPLHEILSCGKMILVSRVLGAPQVSLEAAKNSFVPLPPRKAIGEFGGRAQCFDAQREGIGHWEKRKEQLPASALAPFEADTEARDFISLCGIALRSGEACDVLPIFVFSKEGSNPSDIALGWHRVGSSHIPSYIRHEQVPTSTSESGEFIPTKELEHLFHRQYVLIQDEVQSTHVNTTVHSVYDVLGTGEEGEGCSVTLRSSWMLPNKIPKLLESPPLSSSTSTLFVQGALHDDMTPCQQVRTIWNRLCQWERGEAVWVEGASGAEAKAVALVQSLKQGTPMQGLVDVSGNVDCLPARKELDVTEQVWLLCQDAVGQEDLDNALRTICAALCSLQIRPFVHKENVTEFGQLVKEAVDIAAVQGSRDVEERLDALEEALEKKLESPLEWIAAVGKEKVFRDVLFWMERSKLANRSVVETFHDDVEMAIAVLDMCLVAMENGCPRDKAKIMARIALERKEFPVFAVDLPPFASTTSSVLQSLAVVEPVEWTVVLSSEQVVRCMRCSRSSEWLASQQLETSDKEDAWKKSVNRAMRLAALAKEEDVMHVYTASRGAYTWT